MLPNASPCIEIFLLSNIVGELSYMGNGAIHWRPITRRKWQIQAYNPQLVRNSSSPKALGLAEVVYFVERHLKCRHSNRGDLKEQWSNHKGSPPWGTKDNMGHIKILWSDFFLFFFFLAFVPVFFFSSLVSEHPILPKGDLCYMFTQALLSLAVLFTPKHSTLNFQTMKTAFTYSILQTQYTNTQSIRMSSFILIGIGSWCLC